MTMEPVGREHYGEPISSDDALDLISAHGIFEVYLDDRFDEVLLKDNALLSYWHQDREWRCLA